jgi:oxygen-dependent protoporphyrinogen oxidase
VKVAVLGGGAAGLVAGLTLKRAGADVTVFEAAPVPGGKMLSVQRDGFLFEDGPNSLAARSVQCATLSHELHLDPLPVRPPKHRFVVRGGRLRRAPSLSLLSPVGVLRALFEPLYALASRRPPGDEPLRDFLVRHFGSETGTLLANLLANGVYAGDPERLSASEAFPRLASLAQTGLFGSVILGGLGRAFGPRARERDSSVLPSPRSLWTLRGGLHTLPLAMARELGDSLHLASPVTAIEPEGKGWQLAADGGRGGRFDAVVCALPGPYAAELLRRISPGAAKALAQIRYSPLAVVHLGVRHSDFRTPPKGFGLLDGEGKLDLLGTLFPSSLFADRAPPDHVLLTTLVGGMRRPELPGLDDGRLVELVSEDLRKVLGLTGTPVIQHVHRWEAAVPQYEVGHRALVETAELEVAKLPPFQLAGAAYHGVSVELTLQSGAAAARRLLAFFPGLDSGRE